MDDPVRSGQAAARCRRASSELSKKALESEDLKAKYADLATTAWWSTPADTLAYRDSEEARLAPIIKASGARVD